MQQKLSEKLSDALKSMEEYGQAIADEDAVKDWIIQALILEAKDHTALQEIEKRLGRVEKMLGLKLVSRFPFCGEDS